MSLKRAPVVLGSIWSHGNLKFLFTWTQPNKYPVYAPGDEFKVEGGEIKLCVCKSGRLVEMYVKYFLSNSGRFPTSLTSSTSRGV